MSGSTPSDHLAPLDGLRGIAIALVLWFHVWQITWLRADVHAFGATFNLNVIPEAGFIGVDLFFFISGFCLFYPYARTLFDGRPAQSVATFAYRRAIKILPSYYVSIALMSLLGVAHYTSAGDALRQLVTHAFFVHTFWNDTYGGINGVLWSLGTEVQFYVIFPLVCWCAMRRPLLTFGALAVVAIVYRAIVGQHFDAVHQIDQLPGTLDCFASGMAVAYAYRAIAVRAPKLAKRRTLWTGIALAGVVLFAGEMQSVFAARLLPDWPMKWLVFGRGALSAAFGILALGSLFAVPLWQRVLANPALVFLSLVSYNLYLWHQVVARALVDAHVPPWQGSEAHADAPWGVAFTFVAFGATLLVAWVFTVMLERPLLRRRPFERRSVGAGRKSFAAPNPPL